MTVEPDYSLAALRATETLIHYDIKAAPVSPIPIIKSMPNVLVLPFAEMALQIGADRDRVISSFGESMDAVTSVHFASAGLRYVVAYNQRLPFYMLHRALSRELGHIVLGHDGTRPEGVRTAEAYCFANHLICPRPLISMIQRAGVTLTTELLQNTTGCDERCLERIRRLPGIYVSPELNRAARDQFKDYVDNLISFQKIIGDTSRPVDLGNYMNGYEE